MKELDWGEEFARRLRVKLEARGWSQKELARRADISPTTVSELLNLRYIPSIRSVVNIAHALGCDISELTDVGELIQ